MRAFLVFAVCSCTILACSSREDTRPQDAPLVRKGTPYPFTYPAYFPSPSDSTDVHSLTVEGIALGRHLFYEKMLSADSTISCGSCHVQLHAFSDPARVSSGVGGRTTSRNSMSLANMAWVDKFFWDGRTNSLHEQVLLPIQDFHEMNLSLTDMVRRLNQSAFYRPMFQAAFGSENASSAAVADALSQFVHTMVSADSKYDRYLRGETTLTPLEQQGLQLFNTHPDGGTQRGANCNDCHSGVLQSADAFRNTGLQLVYADQGLANVTGRPTDNGKFRVMSLRNITVTPPFMHDGSLGSLLDVMDHYNLQVAAHPNVDPLLSVSNGSDPNSRQLLLNQQEISALVAFLHTLTDTTFLHNTAFSNPFEQ